MQPGRTVAATLRHVFAVAAAALFTASSASALVIGDFEGGLDGWSTTGNARNRGTVIGIAPTLSSGQLLLQTAGAATSDDDGSLDAFFNFSAGTIDALSPNGNNVTQGSGATLVLTGVQAGDQLTFDFNFLTSETLAEGATYRDFGFSTIRSGEQGEVVRDDVLVMQRLATTNPNYFQSGWQSVTYDFTSGGTVTIGFGVVDVLDTTVNTAMLLDNIHWLSTPEPGTGLMVSFGVVGLALRRRRELTR